MSRQLTITVPDELFAEFQKMALTECRSAEGHLLWLLKRALKNAHRQPMRPLEKVTREQRRRKNEPVFRELRRLHLQAGKPSTRTISDTARKQGQRISHTTVHGVLTGAVLPTWPMLETLVTALHGDVARVKQLWAAANG